MLRLFILAMLVAVSPRFAAAEITVFAAASLKTALDALVPVYEEETGRDVTVALAGTSALARQIEAGAPADIFVSANIGWMDALEAKGLLLTDSRIDLLGNRLVLVAPKDDAPRFWIGPGMNLDAALDGGWLAMALVDAVPAGIYGRSALETLGEWEEVSPYVAQADNVRAALTLVATGAAPLGIVYATDAAAEPRVTIVAEFPAGSHPPIVYPAAIVSGGNIAPARSFLDWLSGPRAGKVFAAQRFDLLSGK